jgi:hypothetical protein
MKAERKRFCGASQKDSETKESFEKYGKNVGSRKQRRHLYREEKRKERGQARI